MIGQAQTGTGKTAAFGLPLLESVDPDRAGGPGARAHADARAVHPGHAGAARVRRAQGDRPRGGLRRRADPHPAGAAAPGRAGRRRHRRPRARPDQPPLAGAALLPLHRARRGRRDARPRLPRGRREDPLARARQPPDRALQRDDAERDPPARRAPPLRPGHRPGQGRDADDRHRRAVLRRDQGAGEERHAGARARGRAARAGDRLHAHEDPLRAALHRRCATRA